MTKIHVVFALIRKSGDAVGVVLSRNMEVLVKASKSGDVVRRARIEDLAGYKPRSDDETRCITAWKNHIQEMAIKAKMAKAMYQTERIKEVIAKTGTVPIVSQETQEWIDNYRAENPVGKFDSSLVPHTNRE